MKNEYVSERLFLKEIDIKEIDDRVLLWFKDDELMRFYTSSKREITKEVLIKSIMDGKENNNLFTFGLYDKAENIIIGTIKLGPINHSHKTSDLVILIGDRNYLGKGLAVEAIKLGNRLAFEEFDMRKLYGGMYLSNISSIKAYTRAGWIAEGRLKGQYFVDNKNEDRLLVGCFNPKYFSDKEIEELRNNESRYL
ncbi:MAG: GNAT family N-acetyltransferase [Bacteroidales bacterium]|nr:GNAT family N-acetyltransferase [Bacteroidales bacterium]MCF8456464.1 GNAT family N-acetyltransferase [Bacteroidales bacterium]